MILKVAIARPVRRVFDYRYEVIDNPFDIRRPYVACRVAEKLVGTTLLGKPAQARTYHSGGAETKTEVGASHGVFVGTK